MHVVHPSDRFFMSGVGNEPIGHMNAADHQHTLVLFNLSDDITHKARFVGPDLARLQRASEGTE